MTIVGTNNRSSLLQSNGRPPARCLSRTSAYAAAHYHVQKCA